MKGLAYIHIYSNCVSNVFYTYFLSPISEIETKINNHFTFSSFFY